MISLTDVTLTFPDGDHRVTAVDRATLTVPAGTVTALTGPSGSGKSSVLAVAAGLIRPDSGLVEVAGVDVTSLDRRAATDFRRTRLGIVFQQANLLPSLTALEQLCVLGTLGGRASRADRTRTRERAAMLLAAVGLADQAGKRPHQLSGGQRQRVNIARALMNEPDALVVDEPTSALDHERGSAIIELILELTATSGAATLLVTHDRSHLDRMDQVLVMEDGRLSAAADALALRS
ncbi:ABC transporter ATP-binding protein [Plantibacter flavus]|uniref:ABC transport system ATP-binding protein n=1 Tax=Plantibacter elymi (nom. nud.) TaxID=199708 RepID=A0ABY1RFY4_9MICO|nr:MULTISPECIES: ABC transporter ATP-binding protein [Plantibacter]MBD8517528.1 ABC transporter ATP-binding protein [Plantibacter sp. CFBP 8804]TKJ95612.1 ABC transporter ATP-binding protein [Plantibacter flavus]CAH0228827.1 putative ABC transporter ATP-binding protein Rv0986 [Plantibacter cousiniae]SMQ73229.1 putative ABC transport system ATP-binding protein [Plantibacter sp. VKM Ac-1784]